MVLFRLILCQTSHCNFREVEIRHRVAQTRLLSYTFYFRSLILTVDLRSLSILYTNTFFLYASRTWVAPGESGHKNASRGSHAPPQNAQPAYINYEGISRMQAAGPTSPLPLPLSLLSLLACDEIFIVPGPLAYGIRALMRNRTDLQSHESFTQRPARREQQKFAKARKSCRSSATSVLSWVVDVDRDVDHDGPRSILRLAGAPRGRRDVVVSLDDGWCKKERHDAKSKGIVTRSRISFNKKAWNIFSYYLSKYFFFF